ncbi:hypothetical protein SLS58_006104 [Diplodia intermedia]|uniref:Uncharacterized protein n=1 Tax=Diplodia intermedia TaxID=856260 RepID=A0ABR3TPJ2_9PEZI
MAGVSRGRRELLNLYRVRSMTAQFASRLGRGGVYNTAELDAFTHDPLVDADMQRVMEGVRGMRKKLKILAIRRRCLKTGLEHLLISMIRKNPEGIADMFAGVGDDRQSFEEAVAATRFRALTSTEVLEQFNELWHGTIVMHGTHQVPAPNAAF